MVKYLMMFLVVMIYVVIELCDNKEKLKIIIYYLFNNTRLLINMEIMKEAKDPWFSLISCGLKTVEGRLFRDDYVNLSVGDKIVFINNELGFRRSCKVIIKRISHYSSLYDYLETETLEKCLPTITVIEKGIDIYYKFYAEDDKNKYGILAMEIELMN